MKRSARERDALNPASGGIEETDRANDAPSGDANDPVLAVVQTANRANLVYRRQPRTLVGARHPAPADGPTWCAGGWTQLGCSTSVEPVSNIGWRFWMGIAARTH